MPRLSSALRHHSSCTLVMMTWKWSGIACRMCTGPMALPHAYCSATASSTCANRMNNHCFMGLGCQKDCIPARGHGHIYNWWGHHAGTHRGPPRVIFNLHHHTWLPAASELTWTTSSQGSWMRRCDKHWPVLAQMPAQTPQLPQSQSQTWPTWPLWEANA